MDCIMWSAQDWSYWSLSCRWGHCTREAGSMWEDEVGHTDDVLRVSLLLLLLLNESSHLLFTYYVSYMPLLFLFGSPMKASSLFLCYIFPPLFCIKMMFTAKWNSFELFKEGRKENFPGLMYFHIWTWNIACLDMSPLIHVCLEVLHTHLS